MKQRTRIMSGGEDLLSSNMNKKKDDDLGNSEIRLHRIKPQDHFIEAQVQDGDTLQAIALRFYCSVAELKRINHIHKDNEIFARNTIKIPVTPYSVLTEQILPPTQDNPSSKPHETNVPSSTQFKDDFSIDCNAVVLNSTLTPSVQPYTDNDSTQLEPITEDSHLLPREKEPVEAVVVKTLTSQGADYGIKWYHLLGCLILIGVVIPIFYVVFYVEKPEHSDLPPLQSNR